MTKKIGIVFPGQGAQYIGMGKSLYENFQVARDIYDKASDILNVNLKEICFEGSFSKLNRIENMLPSIYTASVAAFQTLKMETNISPSFMAGHSLGEYAALTCSEAVEFEYALRLVQKRSIYAKECNECQRGTMTIVEDLTSAEIEELCYGCSTENSQVYIACYNHSKQHVICGHQGAVLKLEKEISKRGGKVTPILTGVAFHTPLLLEASHRLRENLVNTPFTKPFCPVISNVYAEPYKDVDDIRDGLSMQMFHPVQWMSTINYMIQQGVTDIVDVGPKNIMKSLTEQNTSYNIYSYHEIGERSKLIKDLQADKDLVIPEPYVIDLIKKCVTVAICTKNHCNSMEKYNELVVIPYRKLNSLLYNSSNLKGIQMVELTFRHLLDIYEGKQVPLEDLILRVNEVLDTSLFEAATKRTIKEKLDSLLLSRMD